MTKRVVPLLGFEWGFWIEEGKPLVKEIRKLDVEVWNEHLELSGEAFRVGGLSKLMPDAPWNIMRKTEIHIPSSLIF
jgi:hypothetical protein